MARITNIAICVICVMAYVITGCSGNPTIPDVPGEITQVQTGNPGISSNRNLLGYYYLFLDASTGTIQAAPVRSAEYHLNLTGMMNSTMGLSVAGVPGEADPPNGLFVFDITIKHPFASALNLTGFDVRGILITPGSLNIGPLVFSNPAAGETMLLNADGYTRWWNPTEFTTPGIFGYTDGKFAPTASTQLTATVNPYKYFADVLYATSSLAGVVNEPLDGDLGRGIFSPGSSNTRRYQIQFKMNPGPVVKYGYAIDCSWMPPNPNPAVNIPDDFPIEANQPEAYRVPLSAKLNTLFYDNETGTGGGVLRMQANVYDWQGQMSGDIAAEIEAVRIYSPDLFSGGNDLVFSEQNALRAVYKVDLTGTAVPTHAGDTLLAVKVTPSGFPPYSQSGAAAPDAIIAAWQALTLDIPDPACIGDSNNDFNEAVTIALDGDTVDQMCAPSDYKDFYKFNIAPGYEASGTIKLYCDVTPTTFGLYDENEILVKEISPVSGVAVLDLDTIGMHPGDYFLRVLTSSSNIAFLYLIEADVTLQDVSPSNPVDVTPDTLFFDPRWVIKDGDLLYFQSVENFWIYEKNEPYFPVFRSTLEAGSQNRPVKVGNLIYFLYYGGGLSYYISAIDVTDPVNPVLHDEIISIPDTAYSIQADEETLFICAGTSDQDLLMYDISTAPLAPEFIHMLDMMDISYQMEFVYGPADKYWLAARESYAVEVFDITDINSVSMEVDFFWGDSDITGMATQGQFMYIARSIDSNPDKFSIVQKDEHLVTFRGNVEMTYVPDIVSVSGNVAYTGNLNESLTMLDVSNPDAPSELFSVATATHSLIGDFEPDGSIIYVIENFAGMVAYDTTVPGSTFVTDQLYSISKPISAVLDGDHIFVVENAYAYSGLKSVDISDPQNARVDAKYFPSRIIVKIDARNNRIAAAYLDKYWAFFEYINENYIAQYPDNPTPTFISTLGMSDDRLYVVLDNNNCQIFDMASFPNAVLTNTSTLSGPVKQIVCRGSVMYVLSQNLYTYSLANPDAPVLIDTYTPTEEPYDWDVKEDYIYLATGNGLEIADISNPEAPVFVSYKVSPLSPGAGLVAVDGQYAYLKNSLYSAPAVVFIWPPDSPTNIGELYGSEYYQFGADILAHEGYFYEASWYTGLHVFDLY